MKKSNAIAATVVCTLLIVIIILFVSEYSNRNSITHVNQEITNYKVNVGEQVVFDTALNTYTHSMTTTEGMELVTWVWYKGDIIEFYTDIITDPDTDTIKCYRYQQGLKLIDMCKKIEDIECD